MITKLTITNFRNHISSRIDTHNMQNVVIVGENGAGKTAILEAVSLLSGERGMRGADMTDIACFSGDGSFSSFADLQNDSSVCVYFNNNDTNRHARINNENSTLTNLANNLSIIWVTPKEDRLFIDSASERRSFFDRMVTNFDSAHSGRTAKFSKLLSERAFALKNGADKHWIDAIDSQLAGTATSIATSRIQYCGEINYFLSDYALSLDGKLEKMLINGLKPGDVERKYYEYLTSERLLVSDKMVIDGPHKSDFGMFNKELKLPVYLTSTGQQKKALFALVLAHTKLLNQKTTKNIVVLLDEAAAHLDENNKSLFFDKLHDNGVQIWATGLKIEDFKNIKNVAFVTCHNGIISNIIYQE